MGIQTFGCLFQNGLEAHWSTYLANTQFSMLKWQSGPSGMWSQVPGQHGNRCCSCDMLRSVCESSPRVVRGCVLGEGEWMKWGCWETKFQKRSPNSQLFQQSRLEDYRDQLEDFLPAYSLLIPEIFQQEFMENQVILGKNFTPLVRGQLCGEVRGSSGCGCGCGGSGGRWSGMAHGGAGGGCKGRGVRCPL